MFVQVAYRLVPSTAAMSTVRRTPTICTQNRAQARRQAARTAARDFELGTLVEMHAGMSFGEGFSAELTRVDRRSGALARRELARWQRRLSGMDLRAWLFQARAGEGGRSYLRLPGPPGCETWLIQWPSGSQAPLHDHGDASAVALVLSGELRERACCDGEWFERTWQSQRSVELPKRIRHTVWNESERVAYSVHVYAPGLARMTYYEPGAGGSLQAIRTEQAEQW